MNEPTSRPENDRTEAYVFLIAGAVVGGALLLHPLIWTSWWWEPLVASLKEGQRVGLWKPGVVLASVLLGLATMFLCLQNARKHERDDAMLRRALYGYNAVLTGLLTLAMLVILNVFIHVWAPRYLDTTEGRFHTVSDLTKRFVADLEKPVHVYVVMSEREGPRDNTVTLLSQLREMNPRYFEYEEVSPVLNRGRLIELAKKFPQFSNFGVIVAYGEKEDNYTVIPASEMENEEFDAASGGRGPRQFNGEVRLMQELMFLAENKKKTVVYFTQGHGEPDPTDPREDGMSNLQLKLMRANFDVRPLKIADTVEDAEAKVPEDADVVVVCGPRRPLGKTVAALEKYMMPTDPKKPKGKLVVMLGPTAPDAKKNNTMLEVGIEDLLRKFNVNPGTEMVLTFALPTGKEVVIDQSPERVIVTPVKEAIDARQPIAQTFKDQPLQWFDVRKIEPAQNRPAGPNAPNFQPQVVIGSFGYVWLEPDLKKPPSETQRQFRADREALRKRVTDEQQPVMIAVTEGSADPHASMRAGGGQTPRLLVIGTSTIAMNQFQGRGGGLVEFDLIRGSLDWCRERYTNIGVQPKTYTSFVMPKFSLTKILVLPAFLTLLSIAGFGLIVWNMRRR